VGDAITIEQNAGHINLRAGLCAVPREIGGYSANSGVDRRLGADLDWVRLMHIHCQIGL